MTHCIQCGKLYPAQRKTARYCSDKCKQNYHRNHIEHNVDVPGELDKALDSLRLLADVSPEMLMRHAWNLERVRNAVKLLDSKVAEKMIEIFGEP